MAIDKLFEDNDCVGCGPATPMLPPPTTNKQYYIGPNSNWFLADVDTGKPSRGPKGQKGDDVYLVKSTMDEMRNITEEEISLLQSGFYKAVTLLGYYKKK